MSRPPQPLPTGLRVSAAPGQAAAFLAARSGEPGPDPHGFHHEAYLYAGEADFLDATLPFVREGLERDEPTAVLLDAGKLRRLRAALGPDGGAVAFAEITELGRNPARIIPVWREFVARHAGAGGRPLRGIGEPVWPGRASAELDECWRHEALLNLAFTDGPSFWLRCPYDAGSLDPAVLAHAQRTHPFVVERDALQASAAYAGLGAAAGPVLDEPLPEPPGRAREVSFAVGGRLDALRGFVSQHAAEVGLDRSRTADLVMAVNEVATNSLRYGGGRGLLRVWQDAGAIVCEVCDHGLIDEPLVGRERPPTDGLGSRGLWLVNQLCDLVQLRSSALGTVVRLHMRR